MPITSDQAVEVLRAAGEPTRLRILALLAREELAVLELTRILGQLDQPFLVVYRQQRPHELISSASVPRRARA